MDGRIQLFQLIDIDILCRIRDQSEIELPGLPLGVGDGHYDVVPGGETDQLAVLPHVGQHWAHQGLVILSVLRVKLGSWLCREYRRYVCSQYLTSCPIGTWCISNPINTFSCSFSRLHFCRIDTKTALLSSVML